MTEISYFYVVLAGLLSFLSPCVLPLIPGYISYVSGSSLNELLDVDDNIFSGISENNRQFFIKFQYLF